MLPCMLSINSFCSQRVDGRDVYDYRELKISVGKVPGLVEVLLGKTRYLYDSVIVN